MSLARPLDTVDHDPDCQQQTGDETDEKENSHAASYLRNHAMVSGPRVLRSLERLDWRTHLDWCATRRSTHRENVADPFPFQDRVTFSRPQDSSAALRNSHTRHSA